MRLLLPAAIAVGLTVVAAISYVRGAEIAVGDLAVTSAWARATPPGANVGAIYITVENRGATDERIVTFASPAAQSIMAHESVEENSVASMRMLKEPTIPARGKLEMKPGGTHLMLMGLTKPLKPGESLPLTLTFEKAGAATVPVEVMPMGASMPMPGMDHAM
jgi:periplasmic copper chaperone A